MVTIVRPPLCLDSLVPPTLSTWTDLSWLNPPAWNTQQPSIKRCRRYRWLSGKRRKSKRQHGSTTALPTACVTSPPGAVACSGCVEPLGTIVNSDRWWVPRGLWAIETSNANSWDSLKQAMLSRSSADIILAQETKLLTESAMLSAQRQARTLGWNPTLSMAHRTAQHHGSGGNAILIRKGIGIAPVGSTIIRDDLRHRIQASWIGGICKGGIYVLSIYLKDAEGLSDTNLYILEQVAVYIKALKGPWIIGGEWRLEY